MRYHAHDTRRTWSIVLASTVVGVCGCASSGMTRGSCETPAVRWAVAAGGSVGERRPVRVWIDADDSTSDGWGARGVKRLRHAIESWNEVSLPVKLVVAPSPRSAEVTVDVIRSFPRDNRLGDSEYRAGLTHLTYDAAGRITHARVFIAKATPYGVRYDIVDQEATLLHELGHALGLPHVASPFALMSNRLQVTSLTAADVFLARSTYRDSGCPRAQLAGGQSQGR